MNERMKAAGVAGKILGKKGSLIVIIAIIPIFFIIGVVTSTNQMISTFLLGGEEEENKKSGEVIYTDCSLSAEVEALRDDVLKELKKYGKEAYINLFLAVIMQESGGRCEDVFQCSESLGKEPNSIGKQQSIEHGVKVLCGYLDHEKVKVSSPTDLEKIKIALQAYNYGGGYITFINASGGDLPMTERQPVKDIGKWTQNNALTYQKKMSGYKSRDISSSAYKILGPYAYGDAYYTTHVLRYYSMTDGSGNASVAEVTGIPENERLNFLFPNGLPSSQTEFEEKYKTTIEVPIYNAEGKQTTMRITVHKKLVNAYKQAFEGMYKIHYKILPGETYAYNWRYMASGTGSLSHHSYGVAIDINSSHNTPPYMGNYYKPSTDLFSIPDPVIMIWKQAGFYWGGDWSGYYKDYMHFTYTNH